MITGPDGRVFVNNRERRSGKKMCEDFMQHAMTEKAGLTLEEVIALRLYTGPAFQKYNQHLRFGLSEAKEGGGAPPLKLGGTRRAVRAKKERHYTTTIHAIASALKKVARVTKLPKVPHASLSPSLPLPLSSTLSLSLSLSQLIGSVGLRASWSSTARDLAKHPITVHIQQDSETVGGSGSEVVASSFSEFLGRISPRRQGGKVYRGMSGVLLPEKFRVPDAEGCRGGVELGFLSTSTSKEQALLYIDMNKGRCNIFSLPPPTLSLPESLPAGVAAG